VYATLGGLTIKTASDPPGEDNASPQVKNKREK